MIETAKPTPTLERIVSNWMSLKLRLKKLMSCRDVILFIMIAPFTDFWSFEAKIISQESGKLCFPSFDTREFEPYKAKMSR